MARHILATVRTDDHEPVTTEWLEACGVWKESDMWDFPPTHLKISARIEGHSVMSSAGSRSAELSKFTRLDIRTICRILGITLNEVSS
jgi:hypothetical protein